MLKSILVPLDPSPYSTNAVNAACRLAKYHNARLTGLVILDIPGIKKSAGPVPLGGAYYAERIEERHRKEAEKRVRQLLYDFSKKCEEAGVEHEEAENQGSPSERIIEESMYYDAMVIGLKTYFHFETSEEAGNTLDKILDDGITPIFGVPKDFIMPDPNKDKVKVLIPFNGAPPAARSLQRFASAMNPDLTIVKLLMCHDDRNYAGSVLDHASRYLDAHGFKSVETEISAVDVIDIIKDKYMDWPDAYVVGTHSKRGFFDFMVGSITKFLIRNSKKPVFIAQ